jgi:uncharacterized protein
VKRRIVVVVLVVLMAASAYAQMEVILATPKEIQAAIDGGADVNAFLGDLTPLIAAAAYNGDPEVITTLLKAGARLEAKDIRYGIGGTALLWAAYNNSNPEVTSTLLKAGADINACTDDGRTALIWAAQNNPNPLEITVLLKAGADATVKDKAGKTAYYYAHFNYILKGTDALKQLEEASR